MLLQLENDSFDIPENRMFQQKHSAAARQFLPEGSTDWDISGTVSMKSNCSTVPMLPYNWNWWSCVYPQWELGERKKHHCHLRPSKKKHLTRLHACGAEKEGVPDHPWHAGPVQRSHGRRAQAPWLLHVLIPGEYLLVLEHAPGVYLFNHLDLDFFPESLSLSLAQMSTMSTRAERWSSEAASASLVALRSCCRCSSLSDSTGLCSSSGTLRPSWLPAWTEGKEMRQFLPK